MSPTAVQSCITYCCRLELEPRRLREEGVDIFIDLGATSEDHGEVNEQMGLLLPR